MDQCYVGCENEIEKNLQVKWDNQIDIYTLNKIRLFFWDKHDIDTEYSTVNSNPKSCLIDPSSVQKNLFTRKSTKQVLPFFYK